MKIAHLQTALQEYHKKYIHLQTGKLASYIPELARVNPELFAVSITTVEGETISYGDIKTDFTLQSTSKPFMYGLSLNEHGAEHVHSKVGVEPSGEAFNSIIELEKKTHRPFNPMINSGAIAIANLIQTKSSNHRIDRMLEHFSELTGRELKINYQVFESEKKTAHRNRAIAHLLRHFDVIGDDIEETLDLYFKQCSVMANIENLSQMAATLANHGVHPVSKKSIYSPQHTRQMLSLILSCGMYDTAGTWTYTTGIPAKSGVSGAIFAAVPGNMGIAVYSPLIDDHGHSIRGLKVIQDLSAELDLSLLS
jgi:glutaminase